MMCVNQEDRLCIKCAWKSDIQAGLQKVCLPAKGELGRRAGREGKTYEVPCLGGRGHVVRGRLDLIMKGCGSGISLPSTTSTSRDGIFRSMSILLVKAKPNGDTEPSRELHARGFCTRSTREGTSAPLLQAKHLPWLKSGYAGKI